jgi:tetratricopeptide (TPR) repeat protein
MRLYFAEFVAGIDLRKEERRLDRIDFVSERAVKSNRVTRVVEDKPLLTGAAKTLEEGEDLLRQRKPAEAKTVFLKVIEQTAEKPVQAKGYYGLARVAILERDPETGDRLFRRLLELDPDGATKSWALLYLGKLADSQGEQDEAEQQYKAALATPDVPDQVKREAEQGLKGAFARKVQ